MLSHVYLSVVYTLHRTLRIVLYSTPYSLLSSPVGFSVSVCMHCSAMYSTKYILLYTVLYSVSPPRFSVSVLSIALHCILQSIVLCTLYSTLSSLLSGSLWKCVCAVLYGVFCSIMYCTPYSTLSPLSCSLWESVCALLYEVFYEV